VKVELTFSARADLRSIREARAQFSEESATELAFALLRRLRQLRDFPYSGRAIPELQHRNLREVLEQGYRILYEVFPDRVEVFGIISSRQQLTT
jgi:plasmid stabilization system protein ParE